MRLQLVVAGMLLGCAAEPSSDEVTGAQGDVSSSEATTTETTSTTASTSSTSTSTSGSSTGSSGDPDDSTGDEGCAIAEPAAFTEVDGCAQAIGEPSCSEGQMHVAQDSVVEWMHDPPHSGPHYPTWESWDEHDTVVPRGNWVHNLEHGGIVLTYRCDGDCEPELDVLREVVAQRPELRILLTADPFLPGRERFAAMSWTWVHRFDPPLLDELLCFADQHENHAPEDVP